MVLVIKLLYEQKLYPLASKAYNCRLQNKGGKIIPTAFICNACTLKIQNSQVQSSMFHNTIITAPFAVIQTNHKPYITNIPTITDFQSLLSQTAV
jgi:hypothetical protein